MTEFHHRSVLSEEVIRFLQPHSGGIYLDGTLGGGGHAALIAEQCVPGKGILIGIDQDCEALAAASENLECYGKATRLVHGNFAELDRHLDAVEIGELDGFILDLGVSSHQLDSAERGFSFQHDAPLDMRMNAETGETAADIVNNRNENELERIIFEYGEERWARRIASFIVKARSEEQIKTTFRMVDIIKGAIPKARWEERIHPATRTFQALRIAVNRELEVLENGLRAAINRLKPAGRGVVISFHSLEDRIVKQTFREYATGCICPRRIPVCCCGQIPKVRILTARPVIAGNAETENNPRARSAKLRAVEKLPVSAV